MLRLSPLPTLSLYLSLLVITFTHFLFVTRSATAAHPLKLPLRHINPSQSLSQSLFSDNHRLSQLNNPQFPITSGASTGVGQYFVDLNIGTPPQKLVLVTDTGSDLIWVTCSACRNCSARPPGSAFLARHSSTYSLHHCFGSACQLVAHPSNTTCNNTRRQSPCLYEYSYADGSLTSGFFAKETVTFNTTSGMQLGHSGAIEFGCAFEISGPSVTGPSFNGAQGVLGLGRGPISLATQLGNKFGNKFSYCLIDYTVSPPPTSYLVIGGAENGVAKPKPKFSYTPLPNNTIFPTFYYVGIKSVYVDNVKLRISPSVFNIDKLGNGGTIMDSGTTLTFLPDPVHAQIVAAFKQRVKLPSPSLSRANAIFDLCVNVSGITGLSLPKLSFKLGGNSLLSPPTGNYFIDVAENVKCLALQSVKAANGISVIGNLMQQGYLFEFDLDRSRLGFTRHGCAIP